MNIRWSHIKWPVKAKDIESRMFGQIPVFFPPPSKPTQTHTHIFINILGGCKQSAIYLSFETEFWTALRIASCRESAPYPIVERDGYCFWSAFRSCPSMVSPFISDGVKTPSCQWRRLVAETTATARNRDVGLSHWENYRPTWVSFLFSLRRLSSSFPVSFLFSFCSFWTIFVFSSFQSNEKFRLSTTIWWWFLNGRRVPFPKWAPSIFISFHVPLHVN